MLRNLTILTLVLTAQLAIAQDGYPQPILYNGDTVVAYTVEQAKLINYNKDSYDECVEMTESLNQEISFVRDALNKSKQYEIEMESRDRGRRDVIAEKNTQIELHEENNKKLQHRLKQGKVLRYIWTGVGAIGGFYLGNKSSRFISL